MINCNAGGDCNGVNPFGIYEYASENGIPEDSCQNYIADELTCNANGTCMNCNPPAPRLNQQVNTSCTAATNYNKWMVSEYGPVSGAANMKAEIYARGPIGCAMQATPAFQAYAGGVYSEIQSDVTINHEVSIVGWGSNALDGEYWIARNSWGTYWGETGFFRIKMYTNNLGIENNCHWGVPVIPGSFDIFPNVIVA